MNFVKRKYSYLFIFIANILFSSILQAQSSTITGTVSDQFGHLPGAKIVIEGTTISTSTDVKGNFILKLDPGEYLIKASFVMYQNESQKVEVQVRDSIHLNFILEPGFGVDQEVSVGSRSGPRTLLEATVPIDVIPQKSISSLPQVELGQILHYTVPSFHSTYQTIADGTDHIDPATLRGLGPDQILVLINGKRRHTSALLNVNGTLGRGSVGTDFNAIPFGAIDRIEVLRDGATANYGSDAIAGVINIILKEQTGITHIDSRFGSNLEGDGETAFYSGNVGFDLGGSGFINITLEYRDRKSTNRSGNYTGPVFFSDNPVADRNLIDSRNFFENTGFEEEKIMEVGNAATRDISVFFNLEIPVSDAITFYSHGGRNFREGEAAGFYRFPNDSVRVIPSLFSNGFAPKIITDIQDNAITLGLRGLKNNWNIDFSNTFGRNSVDYNVGNSNNASMGDASPTSFYSGGFLYSQNTTNLDISRTIDWLQGVDIAFGTEMRMENYHILAGEEASYIDGFDTLFTDSGAIARASGAQGFPGFQPANELNQFRSNNALYLEIESHVTDRLFIGTATRYESYSDFGDQAIGKLSGLYKLFDWFSVSSSFSTGFRAPSLHQVYFNNTGMQILGDEFVSVGTFNNESTVAAALGVAPLKSELSHHFSSGFAAKISNLTLTFDYYLINIKDRIVLSGIIDEGYEEILNPLNVGAAQLFTNAIDTRTQGIDLIATYQTALGRGTFFTSLAANVAETKLVGGINYPETFDGQEDILFNREEVSRIESIQPNIKLISQNSYKVSKLSVNLNNSYFGPVDYIHPDDGNMANWEINTRTGQVESRDQTFSQKVITDLSLTWHFNDNVRLTAGGQNIFNVYPDKHEHSSNISDGRFVYSRRVQQFGVSGAHYFIGLTLNL